MEVEVNRELFEDEVEVVVEVEVAVVVDLDNEEVVL